MRKLKFLLAVALVLFGTAVWAETKTLTADDFDISTMTTGWNGYARKNQSINDTPLKLVTSVDGDTRTTTEFEKGFGTQATSDYTISLNGKGVSFSVTVGRDYAGRESWNGGENTRKLKFQIFDENGTVLAESSEMTRYTPAESLSVDLTGKQSIRLHVDPVDGDSWDWADWVNPTLVLELDTVGDITVDGNEIKAYSLAMQGGYGAATVTKGVLKIDAGTSFSGPASVGANGLIAVDVTGAVTTSTTEGTTIDLFSAPSITFAEGDSVSTAIVLVGPTCNYALSTTTAEGVTKVEARIMNASRAGTTRKVCLWTGAATKWNNEAGNWTSVPTKASPDIGVFCQDATVDYNSGNASWTVYYDEMILRGSKVTLRHNGGDADPGLTMRHIGGKGLLTLDSVIPSSPQNSSLRIDAGVSLSFKGTGTVSPTEGTNKVSFSGAIQYSEGENDLTTCCAFAASIGASRIVVTGGTIVLPAVEGEASSCALPENVFIDPKDILLVQVKVTDSEKSWVLAVEDGQVIAKIEDEADSLKNYWVGGAKGGWSETANWSCGIPTAEQTVIFTSGAEVSLTETVTISNLMISAESRVVLKSSDIWNVHPSVKLQETGDTGTVVLGHVGFLSARSDGKSLALNFDKIEIMNNCAGWSNDYVQGRDSWIEGVNALPTIVNSDLSGTDGYLICRNAVNFAGDNTGFRGWVKIDSVNGENRSDRHFAKPESLFANARMFFFRGEMFLDFTTGTARLGEVDMGESYGANIRLVDGANITLEVAGGSITDTYFGNGFEVNGNGNLTIKKTGEGTLVYGVTKAHTLDVTAGRVEFTGENDKGDDAAVNVIVRAGASVGNATERKSGNNTVTGGDAVTARQQFAFETGACIRQTVEVLTETVTITEATETEEAVTETRITGYKTPVLTINGFSAFDKVTFGVTNPEVLPAVTKEGLATLPVLGLLASDPAFDAKTAVTSESYAPEGSEKRHAWIARVKDGQVKLMPRNLAPGLLIIVM